MEISDDGTQSEDSAMEVSEGEAALTAKSKPPAEVKTWRVRMGKRGATVEGAEDIRTYFPSAADDADAETDAAM
jgi:hypothetical protein